MSQVIIAGDTSGTITLQAPAVSGSSVLTLPATTATLATLTTPSFASTIGVGGATASASGAGISFPATQSASSDANTLDDYEEGTWTPILTAQSGSVTSYSTANATYTKIGNIVTVSTYLSITNIGTASGTLFLTIPIASLNNDWSGFGGEIGAVGFSLSIFGTASKLGFRKYENSTAGGTNYGYLIGAIYRSA
jgi:hypothetical protein